VFLQERSTPSRPAFRGNIPRKCVRGLLRAGWRQLTCGHGRKKATSAQLRAKREDLAEVTLE
jgi:hypothetical protein